MIHLAFYAVFYIIVLVNRNDRFHFAKEVKYMDFKEIAEKRQSCRKFDPTREIEKEKLLAILEAGRLSPSACNGQPYHMTVCQGEAKDAVAKATQGPGINAFVGNAPVLIVISENDYVKSAALGAKIKKNDYRSIDIGILSAYLTARAHELGISSCILGWFSDEKIRSVCNLEDPVRLVIALGYAEEGDKFRPKKRKDFEELISFVN